jgi:hypothetical protein
MRWTASTKAGSGEWPTHLGRTRLLLDSGTEVLVTRLMMPRKHDATNESARAKGRERERKGKKRRG